MKKSLVSIAFVIVWMFSFSQTATPPAAGDGTSGNPLQIATLENLYWLSQNSIFWASGTCYIQTADIDASATSSWFGGEGFPPIGEDDYSGINSFKGVYNGNGHVISDLTINRDTDGVALFGSITGTAVISDLGLINVFIDVTPNESHYDAGALVGWNLGGTITNCYSTGTVNGDEFCGGLIGSNDDGGMVSGCYSLCNVSGYTTIGGLIGWQSGTVVNSSASGNVSGDNSVGGFMGYLSSGLINACFSTGEVSANMWAGGFADAIDGHVTNCYSMSNVVRNTGNADTSYAAFIEYVGNNVHVEYCYSTGSVVYSDSVNPINKGFISTVGSNVIFTSNFFDYSVSGQITGTGATPKISSQLKIKTTFISAGWDFMAETANGINDYWGINPDHNSGYPFLKWQGYKLKPEVTAWPVSPTLECGQTLSDAVLSGGSASVSGNFVFADSGYAPPFGSSSYYDLWFIPDDSVNYEWLGDSVIVAVEDTVSPSVTCAGDQVLNLNQGETFYDVSGTAFDPLVYDNCGVDSVSNSFNHSASLNGAHLPTDTNTIVWTVTDMAGNTDSCVQVITVNIFDGIVSPEQSGIRAFPNPVKETLEVDMHGLLFTEIGLFDIGGRRIGTFYSEMIDMSAYPSGCYYLKITGEKGIFVVEVVKQ